MDFESISLAVRTQCHGGRLAQCSLPRRLAVRNICFWFVLLPHSVLLQSHMKSVRRALSNICGRRNLLDFRHSYGNQQLEAAERTRTLTCGTCWAELGLNLVRYRWLLILLRQHKNRDETDAAPHFHPQTNFMVVIFFFIRGFAQRRSQ